MGWNWELGADGKGWGWEWGVDGGTGGGGLGVELRGRLGEGAMRRGGAGWGCGVWGLRGAGAGKPFATCVVKF